MFMSEDEFNTLIKKNPSLKVHDSQASVQKKTKQHKAVPDILSITLDAQEKEPYSKYKNVKVYIYKDGTVDMHKDLKNHGSVIMKFDSHKEYLRYIQLCEMEQAGLISELNCQESLTIQEGFIHPVSKKKIRPILYKADFSYIRDGNKIIEDVKGKDKKTGKYILTQVFKLKWKLLIHRYPQYIFEVF